MSKVKEKASVVVKPSIKFEGDTATHPLAALFDGKSELMPEVKSIGYMRLPDTNLFVSFVMISKGREIISVEVEQPNLRAIAEESAKIAFVTQFMGE